MKKKVLVVEDNPDHWFILKAHLEIEDYEVFRAESATQAREVLSREPIDLIVMDLTLPDISGVTFLQSLKENPRCASIPVIVTSGISKGPDDMVPLKQLGIGEYFLKPYEPGELMEAVAHLIS